MNSNVIVRLSFAVLVLIVFGFSYKEMEFDYKCPIDNHEFKNKTSASGTSTGIRLDLKPIGDAMKAPWKLPKCPKCHFIIYKDKFKKREIEILKKKVLSTEYQNLSKKMNDFHVVAKYLESLKENKFKIAHAYLRSSWVEEKNETSYVDELQNTQTNLKTFLEKGDFTDSSWTIATLLYGEILRLQGKFDESYKHFHSLKDQKNLEQYIASPYIKKELELIKSKNLKPSPAPKFIKPIGEDPETLGIKKAKEILGYDTMLKEFEIIEVSYTDGLFIILKKKNEKLIDEMEWRLSFKNGKPEYTWYDFLKKYIESVKIIKNYVWISKWKSVSEHNKIKLAFYDLKLVGPYFGARNILWKHSNINEEPYCVVHMRGGINFTLAEFIIPKKQNVGIIWAVDYIHEQRYNYNFKIYDKFHWLDSLKLNYEQYLLVDNDGSYKIKEVPKKNFDLWKKKNYVYPIVEN